MKTRPLFLLLFLGGLVLFGCKKSKTTVHEPDTLVKQDSFQHIVDSLHIVSLEPTFVGKYLVSGTSGYFDGILHPEPPGTITSYSIDYYNDTLTVSIYNNAYLKLDFQLNDHLLGHTFACQPLSADTGTSPYLSKPNLPQYYYLHYQGAGDSTSYHRFEYDLLSFSKVHVDSIYFQQLTWLGSLATMRINLSGVKIH